MPVINVFGLYKFNEDHISNRDEFTYVEYDPSMIHIRLYNLKRFMNE